MIECDGCKREAPKRRALYTDDHNGARVRVGRYGSTCYRRAVIAFRTAGQSAYTEAGRQVAP